MSFRCSALYWLTLGDELWELTSTMNQYPCTHMQAHAQFTCDQHEDLWDCPDAILLYNPKFEEYGIPIRDGGRSRSILAYCPWCGTKLPDSKRDAWFDALEAQGIDPWQDEVPEAFKSDAWWRDGRD